MPATTVEKFSKRDARDSAATSSTYLLNAYPREAEPFDRLSGESRGRYYRENGHYPRRRRATFSFQLAAISDLSYEHRAIAWRTRFDLNKRCDNAMVGRKRDREKRENPIQRFASLFIRSFRSLSFGGRASAWGSFSSLREFSLHVLARHANAHINIAARMKYTARLAAKGE